MSNSMLESRHNRLSRPMQPSSKLHNKLFYGRVDLLDSQHITMCLQASTVWHTRIRHARSTPTPRLIGTPAPNSVALPPPARASRVDSLASRFLSLPLVFLLVCSASPRRHRLLAITIGDNGSDGRYIRASLHYNSRSPTGCQR